MSLGSDSPKKTSRGKRSAPYVDDGALPSRKRRGNAAAAAAHGEYLPAAYYQPQPQGDPNQIYQLLYGMAVPYYQG